MDPRLIRLKPVPATRPSAESKSPVQDPRTHPTPGSSGPGSGGSTPVHSHNPEHNLTLPSFDDASLFEKAFLKFGTSFGDTSIYRRKKDYLREQSKIAAEELSRAEQTSAQFPVIVELARQHQNKIDSTLEHAEKSHRDFKAAETTAAQDLVRILFDLVSRSSPKTKSLEVQIDTLKREIKEIRSQQTSSKSSSDETTTKLATVSAENEKLKTEISALKDDIKQLQSKPCPDSVTMVNSMETLRRENKEQISQVEDSIKRLQGLPEKLEDLRKDLTAEGENAAKEAKNVDSKLEDLQRELSKKGSQLAMKGLETHIQTLSTDLKAATQSRTQLIADVKTLQEVNMAARSTFDGVSVQKFDQVIDDLTKKIEGLNRTCNDEIEALRLVVTNQGHVSTTSAQLHSLGVSIEEHSRDIQLIRTELTALLSKVDSTVAESSQNKAITANTTQIEKIQTHLSSIEARQHEYPLANFSDRVTQLEANLKQIRANQLEALKANTPDPKNVPNPRPDANDGPVPVSEQAISYRDQKITVEEVRQLLKDLKQEKDTQFEESHNIITGDMERLEHDIRGKIEKLQAQVQTLEELCGELSSPTNPPGEERQGLRAALTLPQRIEEVKSQLENLRAKYSDQRRISHVHVETLDDNENIQRPSPASEQVGMDRGKLRSTSSQSIDAQLETHKNQILDLDKTLTTLMRAQMSSDDREALQIAKTLRGRMEKQEHQHQWLRFRIDNMTTESLHRQIIGYVAPVLPKFEQGLLQMNTSMENLEKRVAQLSNQLEASGSDSDSRVQLVEDNLTGLITKTQEQHETLATQFRETRDDVLEQLKGLDSLKTEFEDLMRRVQQMTERKAEHETDREHRESVQETVDGSSASHSPMRRANTQLRNRPVTKSFQLIESTQQGQNRQKAAKSGWIDSDPSEDELELSSLDETNVKDLDSTALLQKFKKPVDRKASTPSSQSLNKSVRSSPATPRQKLIQNGSGQKRKRKRGNISSTGDKGVVESEDDNVTLPRKRVQAR